MNFLKEVRFRLGPARNAHRLHGQLAEYKRQLAEHERQLAEYKRQAEYYRSGVDRLPPPDPKADRISIFRTILGPLAPGRLVDLGCGHGKFSLAAHGMGWSVTGVDARTTRMPMAEGIEWVHSDVRRFDPAGYDCICVLGLLYHLTLEDQLALLRKCARTLTIVDTHVAGHGSVTEGGYEGSYFDEVPGATPEERAVTPTASWGNEVSFWPTQESLLRMARDCGFSRYAVVLPPHQENRTFYILYP